MSEGCEVRSTVPPLSVHEACIEELGTCPHCGLDGTEDAPGEEVAG